MQFIQRLLDVLARALGGKHRRDLLGKQIALRQDRAHAVIERMLEVVAGTGAHVELREFFHEARIARGVTA